MPGETVQRCKVRFAKDDIHGAGVDYTGGAHKCTYWDEEGLDPGRNFVGLGPAWGRKKIMTKQKTGIALVISPYSVTFLDKSNQGPLGRG